MVITALVRPSHRYLLKQSRCVNYMFVVSFVYQIAETYSFLPREAVTRFLMSCADCQKRMHLSLENNNNDTHVTEDPPIIDFSLPITTTYLNHMRSKKGYLEEPPLPYYTHELKEDREVCAVFFLNKILLLKNFTYIFQTLCFLLI